MQNIIIYTTTVCPYCVRAKALLNRKKLTYQEINVDDEQSRNEMLKKTGGKRIFLMAPLHHHFEKKGWPETKVVIRFWILAIIFALIGLSSLKLR